MEAAIKTIPATKSEVLTQCRLNIGPAGPILSLHWVNVSCLLASIDFTIIQGFHVAHLVLLSGSLDCHEQQQRLGQRLANVGFYLLYVVPVLNLSILISLTLHILYASDLLTNLRRHSWSSLNYMHKTGIKFN